MHRTLLRSALRRLREPSAREPSCSERGSAAAEFVMVGALLTLTALSVVQLALGLHVRNTLVDAASEGARYAALADRSLGDGIARTRELIAVALGTGYASDVSAQVDARLGRRTAVVTVRAPLPLIGLAGLERGLEVRGHAPIESFE